MKKVLLPLLMLMAISSFLLAVESAPSAIVGYVKYPCLTGNNFVALPMDCATLSSVTIGAANPTLTSMATWDAITQSWSSSDAYDDGAGGFIFDPPYDYTPGTPLMVFTSADFTYFSMGSIPTAPVFPLEIANNAISVPLDKSNLSDTVILGAAIPQLTSIALWDNVNQGWSSSDAYDDGAGGIIFDPPQDTPIGTALMIYSTEQFNWPTVAKGASQIVHATKTSKAKAK